MEKTLESPLDCKEIKPVNPKGNQPWIFIGRTNAEVEAPIFWPHDMKRKLIGKDFDTGKDWRQKKRAAEGSITNSMDMNLSKSQETVKDKVTWCSAGHVLQRVRHNLVTEQQQQQIRWLYFSLSFELHKYNHISSCLKSRPGEKDVKILFLQIYFASQELIFLIAKSETVVWKRVGYLYVNLMVYTFSLYWEHKKRDWYLFLSVSLTPVLSAWTTGKLSKCLLNKVSYRHLF